MLERNAPKKEEACTQLKSCDAAQVRPGTEMVDVYCLVFS
jgi:hypothetical protein